MGIKRSASTRSTPDGRRNKRKTSRRPGDSLNTRPKTARGTPLLSLPQLNADRRDHNQHKHTTPSACDSHKLPANGAFGHPWNPSNVHLIAQPTNGILRPNGQDPIWTNSMMNHFWPIENIVDPAMTAQSGHSGYFGPAPSTSSRTLHNFEGAAIATAHDTSASLPLVLMRLDESQKSIRRLTAHLERVSADLRCVVDRLDNLSEDVEELFDLIEDTETVPRYSGYFNSRPPSRLSAGIFHASRALSSCLYPPIGSDRMTMPNYEPQVVGLAPRPRPQVGALLSPIRLSIPHESTATRGP